MVGMLIPGQVISIRKLAALFGTSAMPVRDALSQLVAANALEEMPNRSLCVPILSRDRIRDLFEARAALETLAASRACTRDGKRLADIIPCVNHFEVVTGHDGFAAENAEIVGKMPRHFAGNGGYNLFPLRIRNRILSCLSVCQCPGREKQRSAK